jgi:hypothetical protein
LVSGSAGGQISVYCQVTFLRCCRGA